MPITCARDGRRADAAAVDREDAVRGTDTTGSSRSRRSSIRASPMSGMRRLRRETHSAPSSPSLATATKAFASWVSRANE
jgi:hypothetical protein